LNIVDEYRKRHVPLDCIVQDWRYWEENYWGEKWFDKTRYPDPGKLMDDLHKRNVKLMISIWPNMNGNGPNQRQLVENKCMLGNNSTYNPFMKKARDSGSFMLDGFNMAPSFRCSGHTVQTFQGRSGTSGKRVKGFMIRWWTSLT